jgi:cob(I)alamin adenosyltransferase
VTSSSKKRIYTRYGDTGETSLLYGGRVSKNNPHTEAYGITDEAVSAMGLARALSQDVRVKAVLTRLQRELVTVAAELATDPERYDTFNRHFKPVTPEMVTSLEALIDGLEEGVEMPKVFILPGGSPASAAIDMARAIIRTAERRCVGLQELGRLTNLDILRYLNRLGDLLFVLARYQDRDLPIEKATADQA